MVVEAPNYGLTEEEIEGRLDEVLHSSCRMSALNWSLSWEERDSIISESWRGGDRELELVLDIGLTSSLTSGGGMVILFRCRVSVTCVGGRDKLVKRAERQLLAKGDRVCVLTDSEYYNMFSWCIQDSFKLCIRNFECVHALTPALNYSRFARAARLNAQRNITRAYFKLNFKLFLSMHWLGCSQHWAVIGKNIIIYLFIIFLLRTSMLTGRSFGEADGVDIAPNALHCCSTSGTHDAWA